MKNFIQKKEFLVTFIIALIAIEGFIINSIYVAYKIHTLPYAINETRNYLEKIVNPLIEDVESDFAKAILLMNWVHNTIKLNFTHGYDTYLHPIEILKNSKGGCGQYSIVFTSLCTISGLESRVIGIENNTGSGHIISEVLIDGKWRVFDTMFNIYYNYSAWEMHNKKILITKPSHQINFFRTLYDNIRMREYSKNYRLEDLILSGLTPTITLDEKNYKIFYGGDKLFWYYKFTSSRHPLLFSIIIWVGCIRLIYPLLPTSVFIYLVLLFYQRLHAKAACLS